MPIPKLKLIETNYNELDYEHIVKNKEIRLDREYSKAPICLEIVQDKRYRFGTFGNISVIGGKSKGKKTFYLSALLAACITGYEVLDIRAYMQDKEVVLFDTEQSDYDLYSVVKRIMIMSGNKSQPNNFKAYCLRPFSPEYRLQIIETYLDKNKNIGLIAIDGIRDLLVDINDSNQSTEIMTKLMQWTDIYNIHACCVLHENPGSDKLRGHVGTELSNKAETVVSVELNESQKEISNVIAKFTRGTAAFSDYSFSINNEGLPELRYLEENF